MKLGAKLEAKLGAKLGAKPGTKLEEKPHAIFPGVILGTKIGANPGAILGTNLSAILYMQDYARICARSWSEFLNQNTLKYGANGLFCCSVASH